MSQLIQWIYYKVDKVLDQFWQENLDLKLKVCHEILFEVLFLHLNSSFCDKSSVKLHITVTQQKDRITFSPSWAQPFASAVIDLKQN